MITEIVIDNWYRWWGNTQATISDILKGNPKCVAEIPSIVDAARKYGGNPDTSTFTEDLTNFCSSFKVPGRSVSTLTLQAISGIKLAPAELCPHFITSMLMALAANPIPNVITGREIKSIISVCTNRQMMYLFQLKHLLFNLSLNVH